MPGYNRDNNYNGGMFPSGTTPNDQSGPVSSEETIQRRNFSDIQLDHIQLTSESEPYNDYENPEFKKILKQRRKVIADLVLERQLGRSHTSSKVRFASPPEMMTTIDVRRERGSDVSELPSAS